MTTQELKDRLKSFAYRSIKVYENLPGSLTAEIISKQLLRSALSAAANYRAATRSQSKKQFLAKLNIALEEMDESSFWLEVILDLKMLPQRKLTLLIDESIQLTKILSATKNTASKNLKKS